MAKPTFTTAEIVTCLLDLSAEKHKESGLGGTEGKQAWILLEAAKRIHDAHEDARQQNVRGA